MRRGGGWHEKTIQERAALPKHIEILGELPKTAVGKVFKPDLRRLAITRVFNAALSGAGQPAEIAAVVEDKKLGLVARMSGRSSSEEGKVAEILGAFTGHWEWAD